MRTATRVLAAAVLILCAASCIGAKESDSRAGKPQVKVVAVNQRWHFVVLNFGSQQGAAVNTVMFLKRGDSQIAEVRISQVEASTAVANVVAGTLAGGFHLREGDRAIFPGS